jgi:hypothetical protein
VIRSAVLLACAAALAAVETPDPARFVVPAGSPAALPVTAQPGAQVAWALRDAVGRAESNGTVAADAAGAATIALTPAAGWHELVFADGSRLGLVALDPACGRGQADPFFAIDCAMAWLVKDDGRRDALARMTRNLGLAMGRERLSWNGIQPAADRFDGDNPHRNDRLRAQWAAVGVPLLEVFHDAPAWMGKSSGKYPQDLAAAATAWRQLGTRWATTGAVEVWNEPDLTGFSGGGAIDHLVALHRAVQWGLHRGAPEVQVGGAVLTGGESRGFRARLWANGLSAASDFISFHHYGDPRAVEAYIATLRRELAAAGDGAVPLWITESGKPWPLGTDRPSLADDATSALTIAVRAAEARACGIARHFAFVLPFYPENQNNFGLTGRDGTPLLALAAYSHLARRLAGLGYAGDLAVPGALRARVFADGARAVAVVWLGGTDLARRWTPGFPLLAAYGIDGRRLPAAADGSLAVPDGAVVCELAPAVLAGLVRDTPAAELTARARAADRRALPSASPLVLQLVAVPDLVEPLLQGWKLAARSEGVPFTLRVWNLASTPARARLRLLAPAGGILRDGVERAVELPAQSSATVAWQVQAGDGGTGVWRVEGTASDGAALPPFSIATASDIDGERLLASLPAANRIAIPAAVLAGSDANIAAGATRTCTVQADGSMRLEVRFASAGDNWAYPRITAPAALAASDAVLVRLRCAKPATVRLFAFEGGVGWYTAETQALGDGRWQWALVRFTDLDHCSATEPDANGRLDLDRVSHLSLGFNSQAQDNVLEIDRCHLLRLDAAKL